MAGPTPIQTHWNEIYEGRDPDELGWYEPVPSTLPLVVAHSTPARSVIDVGGGASRLSAELIGLGYADLTVLDVSSAALRRAADRLGERIRSVALIEADVTRFVPSRHWDVWHDRAVFHFLVDPADRAAYHDAAAASVAPGGVAIVATFGPDGPSHCAGLPVLRFDGVSLAAELSGAFDLVTTTSLAPVAGGDTRPYVVAVVRRN